MIEFEELLKQAPGQDRKIKAYIQNNDLEDEEIAKLIVVAPQLLGLITKRFPQTSRIATEQTIKSYVKYPRDFWETRALNVCTFVNFPKEIAYLMADSDLEELKQGYMLSKWVDPEEIDSLLSRLKTNTHSTKDLKLIASIAQHNIGLKMEQYAQIFKLANSKEQSFGNLRHALASNTSANNCWDLMLADKKYIRNQGSTLQLNESVPADIFIATLQYRTDSITSKALRRFRNDTTDASKIYRALENHPRVTGDMLKAFARLAAVDYEIKMEWYERTQDKEFMPEGIKDAFMF